MLLAGGWAGAPPEIGTQHQEKIAMQKAPVVTVTYVGMPPSKPPRRAYRCLIEVSGAPAEAMWVLLPSTLDHPLADSMPVISVELRKSAAGQIFLQAYDHPGFVVFPMPESGRLRILDWEFSTFNQATGGEIWIATEVRLTSGGTLHDLAVGALAPPAELPEGPAVLAQWSAPAQTRAIAVKPFRAAFRILGATVK
jgi:hypothetical protein